MLRSIVSILCLIGVAAAAEPHLAIHPLETGGIAARDAEQLGALFEVLLAKAPGIKVAGTSRMDEALAASAGTGCELRDSCLRFLAESTDSLYGMYLRLDLKPDALVATSRVVRIDGVVVRQVRIPVRLKGKLSEVAHQALTRALAELKLAELESSLPSSEAPPEGLTPPPVPPAAVEPAQVHVEPAPRWKNVTGWTLVAAGGATLAVGGVFAGLSAAGLSANPHDARGLVTPDQAEPVAHALDQGRIATVLVPIGAAVAAVGVILLLTPPSEPARVSLSVVPLRDGAALSFSGPLR